jgi:uncharacterized protein YecA (UPF0149 family)
MDNINFDEIGDMMGVDPTTINQLKKLMQDPATKQKAINMFNSLNPNGSKIVTKKGKKIKPNSKCPCKSGLKYKKCCYLNILDPPKVQTETKKEAVRKPTYNE